MVNSHQKAGFPLLIHRYSHPTHSSKSPKILLTQPKYIQDNTQKPNALLWKN